MSRSKKLLLVSTILGGLVSQAWAQGNTPSGPVSRSITVGKGATANPGGNGSTTAYNIANTSVNSEWVQCATNSPTILATLCIQAHTTALPSGSIFQEFPLTVSLYSDQPLPNNPVAGYFQTWAANGSAQAWAINTVVACTPGSTGCIGYENDLNNFDCDPGPIDTPNTSCTKAMTGNLTTGVAGYNLGTAYAISVVGAPSHGWHTGLASVGLGVVQDAFLYENDGATRGWELKGPHAIGLDFSAATFSQAGIYLPAGSSIIWNATGHSYVGSDTSGNVLIQSPTNTIIQSPVIFANNSTTSHPALTDTTNGDLSLGGTVTTPQFITGGNVNVGANLNMTDGQSVCWPLTGGVTYACLRHSNSAGKTYLVVNSVNVISIADTTGNMIVKGTVTQSGTP